MSSMGGTSCSISAIHSSKVGGARRGAGGGGGASIRASALDDDATCRASNGPCASGFSGPTKISIGIKWWRSPASGSAPRSRSNCTRAGEHFSSKATTSGGRLPSDKHSTASIASSSKHCLSNPRLLSSSARTIGGRGPAGEARNSPWPRGEFRGASFESNPGGVVGVRARDGRGESKVEIVPLRPPRPGGPARAGACEPGGVHGVNALVGLGEPKGDSMPWYTPLLRAGTSKPGGVDGVRAVVGRGEARGDSMPLHSRPLLRAETSKPGEMGGGPRSGRLGASRRCN
mmetsp:Transcript_71883/g.206438  ORF Transcript_71883/g.206438 Transcript_71883/m.206438 type:complete len:288 (+) Transcript_71883:526-1389(+)